MDRINQLRDEAGSNRDEAGSTRTSLGSTISNESFMTASDSPSKYFSLSEVDSTFDITPINDVTLASTAENVTEEKTLTQPDSLIPNLSPISKKNELLDSYKIGKQIEAANILSGGVNIFDNDNSYDGDELVIDDNVSEELKSNTDTLPEHQELPYEKDEGNNELIDDGENVGSKDTEVVLQIDGNNVNAIDIGNGLYLYRKDGEEELAAVQILDDDQSQPSFKFLKVRENVEGNLEVYEEIEVEMPKEVPEKELSSEKKISKQIPIKNINKAICEPTKSCERKGISVNKETSDTKNDTENHVDGTLEAKTEQNLNVKMKLSEARKSPVIGSFTPMTQSTPNKEGIPLTKIMVDQQLHPNRSCDIVKKKIEVHTDIIKQRPTDMPAKVNKDLTDESQSSQTIFEVSMNDSDLKPINHDVNSDKNEERQINKDSHLKEQIGQKGEFSTECNIETKKGTANNIDQSENNATLQEGDEFDSKNLKEIKYNISSTSEKVSKDKIPIDSKIDDCNKNLRKENCAENQASPATIEAILNGAKKTLLQAISVKSGEKSEKNKTEEVSKEIVVDQDTNQIKIQIPKKDVINTEDKVNDIELTTINNALINECQVSSVVNDQVKEDSKPTSKSVNITENVALNLKEADKSKIKILEIKDDIKISNKDVNLISYRIEPTNNNNNAAVPFGKWTEANRQEFLNKFKAKVPAQNANTNQIKQPNDLNRRDVLKNMDRHRQTNAMIKSNELSVLQKQHVKNDLTYISNVVSLAHEIKLPSKAENKNKSVENKNLVAPDAMPKLLVSTSSCAVSNLEPVQRKEINNQDLIDKAIEHNLKQPKDTIKNINYDDIERKMNELHGTPLVERPDHELREIQARTNVTKTYDKKDSLDKETKIPKLLPLKNKSFNPEVHSEEEVIAHVPITGDITHANVTVYKVPNLKPGVKVQDANSKKDAIITEKEFDKFARRNSVNYENCLKIKLDGKEPHNVVQSIVEKNDQIQSSLNVVKSPLKKFPLLSTHQSNQTENSKVVTNETRPQSKVQMAYQSVLTAKRQKESPITVIEDKPVKVIFVETALDFTPTQLNVQGKELTPTKTKPVDTEFAADSVDYDMLNDIYEGRTEESKTKTKHQRKQVLTPVDTPEMELIEPIDLVIEESPKKKRKMEENKDKSVKKVESKKSYLLGRNSKFQDEALSMSPEKTSISDDNNLNLTHTSAHQNETVSAIDNLVKAAELIETQSEFNKTVVSEQTPLKRGRGRPRKYPLPEGTQQITNSPSSPPKKPRLIDAKPKKQEIISSEDESEDEGIVKENWTMGKINEKLVCPICNKLFRSENVIFKHVKHCTGPSPNRSDKEKRVSRRHRGSDDSEVVLSEIKSYDHDNNSSSSTKSSSQTPTKRKSRLSKSTDAKIDPTFMKGTQGPPVKLNLPSKTAIPQPIRKKTTIDCIVCEICGKKFRQMSYLNSHKLKHKNDEPKKQLTSQATQKSVVSCEVCGKDFRQLHHLAQHRLIHKPVNVASSKISTMSSSDQKQNKQSSIVESSKNTEVLSAGFRCERCSKSFRKLHHLVEHKETHDGLDKQKASNPASNTEKSALPHQCDVCKKTFRKLHHLIEHKEQHVETGSEKSDDKSSSLSTKDIIHECSLCYMVFPNEHSLNKHTSICERKRRQAAAKKAKQAEAEKNKEDDIKPENNSETKLIDGNVPDKIEGTDTDLVPLVLEKVPKKKVDEPEPKDVELKSDKENPNILKKTSDEVVNTYNTQEKVEKIVSTRISETTRKKNPPKEKLAPIVTKDQTSSNLISPVVDHPETNESSEEDDVRYMFNPNYKSEESSDIKVTMNIKRIKRNSLQIEQPKRKELVKRRTSLQHPKVLKSSPLNLANIQKTLSKSSKADITPATDSDDSDVKYSFPKENSNVVKEKTKDVKNTARGKPVQRRSLTGIAKKKFTPITTVTKPKPSLAVIKRRTAFVGHRCDCGELFSSAALLARHTTLAHTPPRIRRQREPAPDKPTAKHVSHKPNPDKSTGDKRKLSVKSDTNNLTKASVATKKSTKQEFGRDTRQSVKPSGNAKPGSSVKPIRTSAHRGVPVPEKLRKALLLESLKG